MSKKWDNKARKTGIQIAAPKSGPNSLFNSWSSISLVQVTIGAQKAWQKLYYRKYSRWALVVGIIRFFRYPKLIVYYIVAKRNESQMSNESFATPARLTHSKKRAVGTPYTSHRTQELIFYDLLVYSHVLTNVVKPWMEICRLESRRYSSKLHKSFDAKLVDGQRRHVLVWKFIFFWPPCTERGLKDHQQIQTSKCPIFESWYWSGIRWYGPLWP